METSMMTATSAFGTSRLQAGKVAATAAMFCLAGITGATAQAMPDTDNGRYALSPVADGVLRLDTRTGVTSICNDKGAGWACHALPDEQAAFDETIGRLQKDNEALKAQLAQREPAVTGKIDEPLPKADSLKPPGPKVAENERKIEIPKIEIPLPSDRDVDRMMSFAEQAWRRLVEMADRVQKDLRDRI
jgi:hypothetical protein